jgi:hypothetical protein
MSNPTDKHSRAVHHRNAQSAHLTDTQTPPFANQLTAVCQCVLFPLKLPRRLVLPIGFANRQPRTSRLTNHHHYTIAITLTV